MLYEGRRESLIAKKLQESRDFVFGTGGSLQWNRFRERRGMGLIFRMTRGGASAATEADLGKGAGVAMVAGQIP